MSTSRVPTRARTSTMRRYLTVAAVLVLSALVLFVAAPTGHQPDTPGAAGGMAGSAVRGVILGPPVPDTVSIPDTKPGSAKPDTGPDGKPDTVTVADTRPPAPAPAPKPVPVPEPVPLPDECLTLVTLPAYTYDNQGAQVSVPDGAARLAEMRADGVSGQLLQAACAAEIADQFARTTPVPDPTPEPEPHECPVDAPIWTGVACVPDHHGPCPAWQTPDQSGQCVTPDCPTGTQVAEDGTCVPDTFYPCPTGTVRAEDGTCVPDEFYTQPPAVTLPVTLPAVTVTTG